MLRTKTKKQENKPDRDVQKEELHLPLLQKKEQCIQDTIISVNVLLRYMTELDYVKAMINDAKSQSEMIEIVAAGSEQMSMATEDISNYVQESNTNMKHAMEEIDHCLSQIDDTFDKIQINMNDMDDVKKTIHEVTDETIKINELVSVIKSVADRTNLLSLNASIEAARAGEQGKGFTVVANEIKKLADNTKQQVDIINKIVEGLNDKIEAASSQIEGVVSAFHESRLYMDNATNGIERINQKMGKIDENFSSISANVQEQSATSQEISSTLQVIHEQATRLRSETDRTGQAFFDLSQKIDQIRIKILSCGNKVDINTTVELCITDHLMWKWRVYNMILGYIQLDINDVGDHTSCRLGKWIGSLDQKNQRVQEIVRKLEKPHGEIHAGAKKAIVEFEKGNRNQAEELLYTIEQNSKTVVTYLDELRKYI